MTTNKKEIKKVLMYGPEFLAQQGSLVKSIITNKDTELVNRDYSVKVQGYTLFKNSMQLWIAVPTYKATDFIYGQVWSMPIDVYNKFFEYYKDLFGAYCRTIRMKTISPTQNFEITQDVTIFSVGESQTDSLKLKRI